MLNIRMRSTTLAPMIHCYVLFSLISLSLAGCYFSSPSPEPLPLLVHRENDGSLIIQFEVCEGEALVGAGIATEDGATRDSFSQGAPKQRYEEVREMTMVVSDSSMTSSSLIADVPIITKWSASPSPAASAVSLVSVRTTHHDVQFDPRELGEGEGLWLVSHVKDHISQTTIASVGSESGLEAIRETCSS